MIQPSRRTERQISLRWTPRSDAAQRPAQVGDAAQVTQATSPLVRLSASALLIAPLFAISMASAAQLPERTRTPGAIATSSTAVVCRPGYAHAARNVPYRVRDAVYTAYGLPRSHRTPSGGYVGPRRGYVIDHLVPLELGGANDVRNLWPQPRNEAHAKDRVEDALHEAVCSARMRLVDAQQRIVRDWERAGPTSLRLTSLP